MNLKEPGAADHSSVEWYVGFNLVLFTLGLCPSILLVLVNAPVVNLKEPGAADYSSVEWDVMFYPILSF